MKTRTKLAAFGAATVLAIGGATGYAFADNNGDTPSGSQPAAADESMAAAPYLYMGWGDPPRPERIMRATGVEWFTMAFILSDGSCNPSWDSERPLKGGEDEGAIKEVRDNGGDVIPSIGGWEGEKLGTNCSSAEELAGAYQKLIDAYDLKAIDVDIENTDEFEDPEVQDRILGALKIVKEKNADISTIATFGTSKDGPNKYGERLIEKSKELKAGIDVFTIMPFDFDSSNIHDDTISAADGLRDKLTATYGWEDKEAYGHMGVSGMNGISDQSEKTTPETWQKLRDWAQDKGLARFTFWAVNRDRPCPGEDGKSDCSGIEQQDWEFTTITGGYGS